MSDFIKWILGKDTNKDEVVRPEVAYRRSEEGEIEQHSQTWIYISNWAMSEVARLRELNDMQKHDAIQTAALRGGIRRLKDLLALAEPKTEPRKRDFNQTDE